MQDGGREYAPIPGFQPSPVVTAMQVSEPSTIVVRAVGNGWIVTRSEFGFQMEESVAVNRREVMRILGRMIDMDRAARDRSAK